MSVAYAACAPIGLKSIAASGAVKSSKVANELILLGLVPAAGT